MHRGCTGSPAVRGVTGGAAAAAAAFIIRARARAYDVYVGANPASPVGHTPGPGFVMLVLASRFDQLPVLPVETRGRLQDEDCDPVCHRSY